MSGTLDAMVIYENIFKSLTASFLECEVRLGVWIHVNADWRAAGVKMLENQYVK
jgi:hypothetical protein